MAFTQTDLDNVDRAIGSGELTVSFNGRTVTHRSMSDLMAARDLIAKTLASQAPTGQPTFGGRSYGLASFNHD